MLFLSEDAKGENVQRFATTIGNLLCLSFGLMFGVSPGHSDLYLSTATPLNKTIDAEAASWLSALLFLSAIVGALFFGYLSSKIGPKSVLYISGILQIKGWFCIHFGYDILHVYSSRIFAGVAGGAAFAVLPVYIAEISEPAHYASLLGSVDQWRTGGIFLGLLMGTYLPYPLVPILGLGLSIVFCLICPFIQETPYYFMKKGNDASMEKSLRWFRGIRKVEDQHKREFVMELNEFKSEMQGKTRIGDFQMSRWYRLKLFFGCVVLAVGAQLSGIYVILNDGGHVFGPTYTSTKLSTELCLLALALSSVLGTTVSRMIGVTLKRKVLLISTTVVSGISLLGFVLLRTYCSPASVMEQQNALGYLGLLALHMMFANVGLYPLSLIILSEMTPATLRSQITAWTTAISHLSVFFLLKYFNTINILLGGAIGWFWLFAIVSFSIAIFAFFLLPETSDKSSYEVQEVMGYSSNDNIPKINTITNGRINNGANV